MNQVDITSLKTKNSGGCYLTNFEYIVTDRLGAKKEGSGSVAVSSMEAIESQIQHTLVKKLGYSSFTVKFPKPQTAPADPQKRPVLTVKQ